MGVAFIYVLVVIGIWYSGTSWLAQGAPFPVFLAPLYSSFSRDGIMENMNRKIILKLIQNRSGITFTEMKRELNLQNGVLAYHLSLLEKNHYIRSFSDGKYKRFYAKGQAVSGLTTAEQLIMTVIRSTPYVSRRTIAELIEYSQGTVNSTIKKLMNKELISMKKIGKHYSYYPRS